MSNREDVAQTVTFDVTMGEDETIASAVLAVKFGVHSSESCRITAAHPTASIAIRVGKVTDFIILSNVSDHQHPEPKANGCWVGRRVGVFLDSLRRKDCGE